MSPFLRWDTVTHDWLVCDQCPPGTFMQRPCGHESPTVCNACPPMHYTQFWNYLERCCYCNIFCGEHEEVRACSASHNCACCCGPSFFAHAGFCLEHLPCPPGAGVLTPGGCWGWGHGLGAPALLLMTPSSHAPLQEPPVGTQCQLCPVGTFLDSSSSTQCCQPHCNCTALDLTLNVAGSSFHNARCTSCPSFSLSALEPGEPGHAECEHALMDFVAFQDISFRKLLGLQQALDGQTTGRWGGEPLRLALSPFTLDRCSSGRVPSVAEHMGRTQCSCCSTCHADTG
ncbi:PREDICTED: LOW QUALITY PROTEIN: tumor necrosis factor receptor superfamily, member 6b, decoy [Elephantulus edwardii]|uniref:LOW QUALITY PROTEIN: tumor necrosis factor receptor superfamily, member 6b, decoy n=1 Tax=Elephantulus edwardii TaxID=28737 RepID=UPI0003F05874|nr:PREDICTED: LOW QUALITY PROTEIN: tumor necrosis factor receptor superfamily, member 6b, decoy [Elephantulus edwardii]